MTILEWLFALIALINAIAAIMWNKKYRLATDRLIEAKDAEIKLHQKQVEMLERLNPKVLADWNEATLKYMEQLKIQLDASEIKIKELELEGEGRKEELVKAKKAFKDLSENYDVLRSDSKQHKSLDITTLIKAVFASATLSGATGGEPGKIYRVTRKAIAPLDEE